MFLSQSLPADVVAVDHYVADPQIVEKPQGLCRVGMVQGRDHHHRSHLYSLAQRLFQGGYRLVERTLSGGDPVVYLRTETVNGYLQHIHPHPVELAVYLRGTVAVGNHCHPPVVEPRVEHQFHKPFADRGFTPVKVMCSA